MRVRLGTRRNLLLTAFLLLSAIRVIHAAEPDIRWQPNPFVFAPNATIRYIDFENGNDNNAGDKANPWKHHPWDPNAAGTALAASGDITYCFKKGVEYRGRLIADESGSTDNPIQLTVDPSWGIGTASILGSKKIASVWTKVSAAEPDRPTDISNVWYVDLTDDVNPRSLWEIYDGEVYPLHIARTPNWQMFRDGDYRQEWWEATETLTVLNRGLENAEGFSVGDEVTAGRYTLKSRPSVAKITYVNTTDPDNHYVTLEMTEVRKKEFFSGINHFSNGETSTTITRGGPRDIGLGLVDTNNITPDNIETFSGSVVWLEGQFGRPQAFKVISTDIVHRRIGLEMVASDAQNRMGLAHSRYYYEGRLRILDAPGEFFFRANDSRPGGRLYVRLENNRDPNLSQIEMPLYGTDAAAYPLIHINGQDSIHVSGLEFKYVNYPPYDEVVFMKKASAISITGTTRNIAVNNCKFFYLPGGISARPNDSGDYLDGITIADNEMGNIDISAVSLYFGNSLWSTEAAINEGILFNNVWCSHVNILRNKIYNIGFRSQTLRQHPFDGRFTVYVHGLRTGEIAHNVIENVCGSGLQIIPGDSRYVAAQCTWPLIRVEIHHNKVVDSMRGDYDYGGIETFGMGPTYIYNNISGNAQGFVNGRWRINHIRPCHAPAIYLDGSIKNYVFNNIMWGEDNDPGGKIYNETGVNEAGGFLHTIFNNTIYNVAYGFHKGLTMHNRCKYIGNLMVNIGDRFIWQQTSRQLEHATLAYSQNIMHGDISSFGVLGRQVFSTFEDWQDNLELQKAVVSETGSITDSMQFKDANTHEFTLRDDAEAIDEGRKVFVPWALYDVVGEWHFVENPSDPGIILGEHQNANREWGIRGMHYQVPRNNLTAYNASGHENYTNGGLENWARGAFSLNEQDLADEYLSISHAEMSVPFDWVYNAFSDSVPADERSTMEMRENSFLIEAVLRTKPGITGGGIVSKYSDNVGYVLAVDESGSVRMDLHFRALSSYSQNGSLPINDGDWHHIIAEVDRNAEIINIYIDGRPANGANSGAMQATSLANSGDFLVGKAPAAAYFQGALDFLRISRGTLKDAETTIEELYTWEFDGPFLKDFYGNPANGISRDAGAIENIRLIDTDNDRMSDAWETANGLDPANPADATLDADNDGAQNLAEYTAGTNPREAASVLKVKEMVKADPGVIVKFDSVVDRLYTVEYIDDAASGTWTVLKADIAGTGAVIEAADPANSSRRLYRVKARRP